LVWRASQTIPVEGATVADWNRDTFWHHPWGRSGVHKGIDIFAKEGTPVLAATGGVVLYAGTLRGEGLHERNGRARLRGTDTPSTEELITQAREPHAWNVR
jgi:hypothetical protein